MEKREHMRQSASTADIAQLSETDYLVTIHSAWLDGITASITAVFPTYEASFAFVDSFGFSEWKFLDFTE